MGGSPVVQQVNKAIDATPADIKLIARGTMALGSGGLTELANGAIDQNVRKPKREAEALAGAQMDAQAASEAALKTNERVTQSQADTRQVRNADRAKAAGSSGRSGTILTSPLGVVGGLQPGVGGKTLLGM